MKIMTFNTQHCNIHPTGRIDIGRFAEYLRSSGADVIGLNEIRGEGPGAGYTPQLEELRERSGIAQGYFAPAISLREGLYGNAMLSRLSIVSVENVPIPDPDPRGYDGYYETRCLIKARLENGLTVLVTHFGLNPDEQRNAVDTVLRNLEDERCVLMGDLNLTPDSPLLDPIRERMTDTASFTQDRLLTFPSDAPRHKIDYIFVSRDLRVKRVEVPCDMLSDHLPYAVEIEF